MIYCCLGCSKSSFFRIESRYLRFLIVYVCQKLCVFACVCVCVWERERESGSACVFVIGGVLNDSCLRLAAFIDDKSFEHERGHSNNSWHSWGGVRDSVTKYHKWEWGGRPKYHMTKNIRLHFGIFLKFCLKLTKKVSRIIWMAPISVERKKKIFFTNFF